MTKRSPDKHQTLRILRDRGVPVSTVIDVGICHGTPELMQVWPDKRHVLFEPVAEFSQNIIHSYRNISHELHMMAVGDSTGTIGLKTSSAFSSMAISHSRMTDMAADGDANIRTVPKIALDNFLPGRNLNEPYLLKGTSNNRWFRHFTQP